MTIASRGNRVRLEGCCGVEEAETLLAWLAAHPGGEVHLRKCEHLHASLMQVLMAARPAIASWPADQALARLLRPVLAATFLDQAAMEA